MSKKKRHEEHPGETVWIYSFCDLALCLLSFFVILSAGASKNVEFDPEFAELVAAIKKAFRNLPPAPTTTATPADLKNIIGALKNQTKGKTGNTGKPGEASQRIEGMSGRHTLVTTVRTGSQTTIGGCAAFGADSAEITPEALDQVREIAEKIRGHMNVFLVKGHTSRDEEYRLRGTPRDLAYDRATAVLNKLVELGVAREGLRVESCRDFEPVREGAYSEVARGENRRVEVVATEALVSEYRGRPPIGSAANKLIDLTKKLDQKLRDAEAPEKK